MYSGEFDGAAAFAGGGFMPSQATTVPDPSSSFSKNRNVRTLLPMTVKQLSELSSNDESSASIDGADVNTITVVGIVCDMQDKEPQFIFLIDDGTGRIECSRWAHEQMEFNEVNQISKGMYVRVYGHLKAFQDKRSLNAYSLRYRFNLFFFFLMFELNHMKNIKVSIYLLVAVLSICFMLSILCMQQYSSYVVR
ncbi:hypothetical protein CICLE_v10009206mg [Citrus x clementina]|uniref:OB domain-containing protein n=1 Tax=Citrus clementina TaxID=85681 RepID=V4WIM2_CITCL|nr:hypothetical protein CICLE_v10009206mg [Citrus x clementina]